ncbi:MAG: patatin-like phospholipase family protein [Hyphomicrobium sp.]|jgi:NTE family protein
MTNVKKLKIAAPTTAGQIVLVFQGGGALGAYQAGVYQALHEAGIEPDWIIGTSIGAINAALIAGNEPQRRLSAIEDFWKRMADKSPLYSWPGFGLAAHAISNWQTITGGIKGFFEPQPLAFFGPWIELGAEHAGYYSTAPLEKTLSELVDFGLINRNRPRLTVGAAHVRTSQMRYFDTRQGEIGVEHIMASGALPPAFPAVRIDGDLYWDGGILSNTPAEVIFDDHPRRNSLVFSVHLWNPIGPEPQTMSDVALRHKDIQYSSRVATHILRQAQIHRLRHVIKELTAYVPESVRKSDEVQKLAAYACVTKMHIVQLLSPSLEHEDQTKDIDFSLTDIRQRWQAGYERTLKTIELAPWTNESDPLEGVVFHELEDVLPADKVAQASGQSEPQLTDLDRNGPARTTETTARASMAK